MNTIANLLQMIKNGGNPQQLTLSFLEPQLAGNPVLSNLVALAKEGKTNDIEAIARKMLREQGIDFDKEFNEFKRAFKL